ncbi:hypothetical protein [Spirosoma telluris]|uniref:hypothetical protein n=1 Tax=Spirosoma telluris TaxID=2183553 RepID=UPI0018DD1DA7
MIPPEQVNAKTAQRSRRNNLTLLCDRYAVLASFAFDLILGYQQAINNMHDAISCRNIWDCNVRGCIGIASSCNR